MSCYCYMYPPYFLLCHMLAHRLSFHHSYFLSLSVFYGVIDCYGIGYFQGCFVCVIFQIDYAFLFGIRILSLN